MVLSAYSVLGSLVSAGILLFMLRERMLNPQRGVRKHPSYISLLLYAAFFRLLFPVDWDGLNLFGCGSRLNEIFSASWIGPVTGYGVLSYLWLAGALFQLHIILKKYTHLSGTLDLLKSQEPVFHVKDFMPDYAGTDYPIIRTESVKTPMAIPSFQLIILPKTDYTEAEMDFILRHELEHLYGNDAFILSLLHLLQILYWFLPVNKLIGPVVTLFCEIRVDQKVTRFSTEASSLDYLSAMISVSKKTAPDASLQYSMAHAFGFAIQSENMLSLRIRYLFERISKPSYPQKALWLLSDLFVFCILLSLIFQ